MPEPRLTIGIPTYNRPERVHRAIQSAIGQTIPVRVLIADDGTNDETEKVCRQWMDHPNFEYIRSGAKTLWQNWRFVAHEAVIRGAEFFAWLQDDDILRNETARRMVRNFDHYPGANVYCANLKMGYDNLMGCLWVGNWGPKIPVDIMYGQATTFSGKLLVPVGYFDSWAMSPAKAFRVDKHFVDMLYSLPDGCDMFTERLDIATVGMYGEAICDPASAGVWIMHGRNESQVTGHTCNGQVKVAFEYLDSLMDNLPGWREELFAWLGCLGTPGTVKEFHKNLAPHRGKSPYAAQITQIFEDLLIACGEKVELESELEMSGAEA